MPKSALRLKRAVGILEKLIANDVSGGQRADLETVLGLLRANLEPPEAGSARGEGPVTGPPEAPAEPQVLCRVLIAEDNQVNQRVACRLLQELGCRVDVSSDGVQALEYFDRESYDMIFLDCRMPRLDGYETIGEIRRREELSGKRRTPVVAMTAFALKGDRERCINAGMDDYLPKPVMLHDLRKVLQKWVPTMPIPTGRSRVSKTDEEMSEKPVAPRPPVTLSPERIASLERRPRRLLLELIDLFRTETPVRVADLRKAVYDRNLEEIEALAHQLKGSSANLGAEKLSTFCERLESSVRDGQLGRIPLLFADLENEAEKATSALETEKRRLERDRSLMDTTDE